MQAVNCNEFKIWREGFFLFLTENMYCVPNEMECEAANSALERGETIALTSGGRIISYLIPDEKGNREIPAKDYEGIIDLRRVRKYKLK